MTDPHNFFLILTGVLAANILTASFVWGAVAYTRLEREGREKGKDGTLPYIALALPIGFLVLGVLTVLP